LVISSPQLNELSGTDPHAGRLEPELPYAGKLPTSTTLDEPSKPAANPGLVALVAVDDEVVAAQVPDALPSVAGFPSPPRRGSRAVDDGGITAN
jgi:hypothetical protein